MREKIEELVKEINDNAGTSRGDSAKIKYEIVKLETERRRNQYLFVISICLFLISLSNLVLAIMKFMEK